MTPALALPVLLVLFGGAMIAIQAPTNAMLAKAGGSPVLAALISFGVGTVALLAAWLASGNRPGSAAFAGLPWYAWVGGLYGAFFVAVAAYAAPRIGVASLITSASPGRSPRPCGSTISARSDCRASPSVSARLPARCWLSPAWCWCAGVSRPAARASSCQG